MASRFLWVPIGLFAAWSGVSHQWYVCHIKQACDSQPPSVSSEAAAPAALSVQAEDEPAAVAPIPATAEASPIVDAEVSTPEVFDDRVEILFKSGSEAAQADAAVERFLDRLATHLQASRSNVTLIGHTDSKGAPALNLQLGLDRAEHVRDRLISRGVAPGRLQVLSKGGASPVASNETEAGRQQNRRVEIVFQDGV